MSAPVGPNDLSLLSSVKDWYYTAKKTGQPDLADDLLQRLLTAASSAILTYIQRPRILPHAVVEVRDSAGGRVSLQTYMPTGPNGAVTFGGSWLSGSGQDLMLREYPATSISSLTCLGYGTGGIPAYVPGQPGNGFFLEPWQLGTPGKPQRLQFIGLSVPRAPAAISVTYVAGYQITGEAWAVPNSAQILVQQPFGRWASDQGVTYATGAALTPVSSNPATGQYVPPTNATGGPTSYQFAAGDVGAAILISYGYIPSDLDYCCTKWVGEWNSYRQRPGEKSRSLSGDETASYDLSAMPKDIQLILGAYKRVVPI